MKNISKQEIELVKKKLLKLAEAANGSMGLAAEIGADTVSALHEGIKSFDESYSSYSVADAKEDIGDIFKKGTSPKEKLKKLYEIAGSIAQTLGITTDIQKLDLESGNVSEEEITDALKQMKGMILELTEHSAGKLAYGDTDKERVLKEFAGEEYENINALISDNYEMKLFMSAAVYTLYKDGKLPSLPEGLEARDIAVMTSSQLRIGAAEKLFALGRIDRETLKNIIVNAMKAAILALGVYVIVDTPIGISLAGLPIIGMIASAVTGTDTVTPAKLKEWLLKIVKTTDLLDAPLGKFVDSAFDGVIKLKDLITDKETYIKIKKWIEDEGLEKVRAIWENIKNYVVNIITGSEKSLEINTISTQSMPQTIQTEFA